LPSLVDEGYEEKDIYNMDESGLFWKAANDETFAPRGSDCAETTKQRDQRITVSL